MSERAAAEPDVVSERVAGEIYPIAVRQARERVVRQSLVIGGFVLSTPLAGLGLPWLCFVGLFAMLVVATVYDFRWWLWLRRAQPVEACTRLQVRTGLEGEPVRSILTAVVIAATIGLWWLFGE